MAYFFLLFSILHSPELYALDVKMIDQVKNSQPGDPDSMACFDFEGPVFIEPGKMIKDHSFIRVNDTFHLFYITDQEKSFGHAISKDLLDWEILDRVMVAGPETNRIWAPCVIPFEDYPGYYLAYYTSVNQNIAQTTHLAFSSKDLTSWTEAVPERFEPFHPDTSWANWGEDHWSNCRDPHFFTDDNDTNYLINTASTKDGFGALSLASSNWYFDWEDIGPLYVHNNWHSIESAFLIKRAGRYHLFFTEELVGGISHMSAATLTGNWNINTRALIDNGHACELLKIDEETSLFSRHTSYALPNSEILYSIRIDTLTWMGDLPEIRREDPLEPDWTTLWGTAFDKQPVFGNVYYYRGDETTVSGFEGNWWISTYEKFQGPLTGTMPWWIQGDEPTGAIRSKTFTVTGNSMRMLVGGGNFPGECYIALFNARDSKMIYSETGKNTELMDERVWDLYPWRGREIYIEIVDNSSSPMGHINIDSIRESPFPARSCPGEPNDVPPEKDIPKYLAGENADTDMPPATHSISCAPNPFNPSTTIAFNGKPRSTYAIRIYDMAGRKIGSFKAETDDSGRGRVYWNGTSGNGKRVAAGIYAGAICDRSNILAVCKLVLVR